MSTRAAVPLPYNPSPALVAGVWYRAVILGTRFEFWVCGPLSRASARKAALEFAGEDVYDASEIESVRRIERSTTA